ncbi:twin-arginine translocation signal domain-containing protein [Enterobacter hormaechei]
MLLKTSRRTFLKGLTLSGVAEVLAYGVSMRVPV